MASSEVVTITLTAKDGASQTFKAVGKSAQDMGKQIDDAGKQASSISDRFNAAGARIGLAFSAAQGALTDFARAAAESEASQARLDSAIENTGHTTLEYTDALNRASAAAIQLGFDDEDAADSIASLTTATGDAATAIDDLSLAEDIARARKISLSQATNIVIAAEQGRMGALQRLGIQLDDNASREERMAALQQKFGGQAEAYSKTTAGAIDRLRVEFGNLEEQAGATFGSLQPFIALLPGLSVAYSSTATAVGALIPQFNNAEEAATLFGVALGPAGLVAGAVAATAALTYLIATSENTSHAIDAANASTESLSGTIAQLAASGQPTDWAKQVETNWARVAAEGAELNDIMTEISNLPPFADPQLPEVKELQDRLSALNTHFQLTDDQINQVSGDLETLFKKPGLDTRALGEDLDFYFQQLESGQATSEQFVDWLDTTVAKWYEYAKGGDRARYIGDQVAASAKGITQAFFGLNAQIADYAAVQAQADIAAARFLNTVGGSAFDQLNTQATEYATIQALIASQAAHNADVVGRNAEAQLTAQTDELANIQAMILAQKELNAEKANYAAFAGMQVQAGDLNDLIAHNQKIKEQQGAYYALADGITTANEAQAAFKQTQDGIIDSQEPYTHQLSEYQTQLGYITDAVDLLNQRQEEGQTLTKDQQQFLDDATAAQQRLQGGTEDATLALGEQALQYAENMKIGDQLNQNMSDSTGATTALTSTINDLIAALQGIPGYVKSYIEVDSTQAANNAAYIKQQLDALNGRTSYASVVIQSYYTGPGVGFTTGEQKLGGIIPSPREIGRAQHGAALTGYSWVGEGGPELIYAPGARVLPHTASVMSNKGRAADAQPAFINRGTMNIYPRDFDDFWNKMRAYQFGVNR
jgi:hypothetical protein